MPNVRASSGMIGTTRGPRSGSRMRFRRIRVRTIVVDTAERGEVVVREVLDEPAKARIGSEEVLPDVRAAGDRELLELPVDRRVHLLDEHAVGVTSKKLVPLAAPDRLDDVPARAAEG